jgi:hypothetical protein
MFLRNLCQDRFLYRQLIPLALEQEIAADHSLSIPRLHHDMMTYPFFSFPTLDVNIAQLIFPDGPQCIILDMFNYHSSSAFQ